MNELKTDYMIVNMVMHKITQFTEKQKTNQKKAFY